MSVTLNGNLRPSLTLSGHLTDTWEFEGEGMVKCDLMLERHGSQLAPFYISSDTERLLTHTNTACEAPHAGGCGQSFIITYEKRI